VQFIHPSLQLLKQWRTNSSWSHKLIFPDFSPFLVKAPINCKLFAGVAPTLTDLSDFFYFTEKVQLFISNLKKILGKLDNKINEWNHDLYHDKYFDYFEEQKYKTFFRHVIGVMFIPSLDKYLKLDYGDDLNNPIDPIIPGLYDTYHIQHLFIIEIQDSGIDDYTVSIVRYLCRPCQQHIYIYQKHYALLKNAEESVSILLNDKEVSKMIENTLATITNGDGNCTGSAYPKRK
jgi:hypothetical protein